jgi:hypothetical protein
MACKLKMEYSFNIDFIKILKAYGFYQKLNYIFANYYSLYFCVMNCPKCDKPFTRKKEEIKGEATLFLRSM